MLKPFYKNSYFNNILLYVQFHLFNYLNTFYELTRSWKIGLNIGIILFIYIIIIHNVINYISRRKFHSYKKSLFLLLLFF